MLVGRGRAAQLPGCDEPSASERQVLVDEPVGSRRGGVIVFGIGAGDRRTLARAGDRRALARARALAAAQEVEGDGLDRGALEFILILVLVGLQAALEVPRRLEAASSDLWQRLGHRRCAACCALAGLIIEARDNC